MSTPSYNDTQGRCDCQGRFTVYFWPKHRTRLLKDAYCPHCGEKLQRTCCCYGTHPTYRREDPIFKREIGE